MQTCCAEKVVFRLACHFSSLQGFIRQNGPVREHDVQILLAGAWQEHDCLKYPMSCLSWISCAQPSRHASVDIVGVILWCVAHSGFKRSPKGFDAGCHQLDGVFKLMCGGLILACLIVLTCIATGPVLLLVKRTAPMWSPYLSSKMWWVFAAQFVFVAPATYSLLLYTFGFVRWSMHLLSMHCFRHTCARAHTQKQASNFCCVLSAVYVKHMGL